MVKRETDKLKVNKFKESNKEIAIGNKRELRQLEKMYVEGTIDNLEEIVEKKKEEIVEEIKEFIGSRERGTNCSINPYIISRYFFKSINPLGGHEPKYTSENLSIVWDLYNYIVYEVNLNIGSMLPSLSSFCKFAGIRLSTFKGYRNSADESVRTIVEKIEDECFDVQISSSQEGLIKERSTIYRMKSEQEKIEKETPEIHIHKESIDLGEIGARLREIKEYNMKKRDSEDYTNDYNVGGVIDV